MEYDIITIDVDKEIKYINNSINSGTISRNNNSLSSISSSNSQCIICLDELNNSSNKCKILFPFDCIHKFHIDCINTWIINNKTCPICRSKLLDEYINKSGELNNISLQDNNLRINIINWFTNNKIKIKKTINSIFSILFVMSILYFTNVIYINKYHDNLLFYNNIINIYDNCTCVYISKSLYINCNIINTEYYKTLYKTALSNINFKLFCSKKENKLLECHNILSNFIIPYYKSQRVEPNNYNNICNLELSMIYIIINFIILVLNNILL